MAASATPGWYHAQGDPAGTERYWDGSAWTEGPRPVGGVPDVPAPSPPEMPDTSETGSSSLGSAIGGATGGAIPPTGMPPTAMPVTGALPGNDPNFGSVPAGGLPPTGNIATPGAAPGQPSVGFPGAPPAAAGIPGAQVFAEESNSTAALVFSILGFFCFITAPIGAFMGYKEKVAIDEGRRDPANRGKAIAAIVIGLVMVLGGLFFFGIFAALVAFSA